MKNWGKPLFLLVCVISVVLRFAKPDLMLFNHDESALLLMAEQAIKSGEWPLHGLAGTKGVLYGPVPVTIFILIGSVLSDLKNLPLAIFYVSNILHFASLLFLAFAVLKSKKSNLVYLILAFMFTSPHLILYARSAWDNPYVMVFSNLLIGLMLLKNENGDTRPVLISIGVLFALSLGTHLMAIPLAVVVACYLWIIRTNLKKFAMDVFLVGATCVVLLSPYIYTAFFALINSSNKGPSEFKWFKVFTGFRSVVVNWADRFTGGGLSYFVARNQIDNLYTQIFGFHFLGMTFYWSMILIEVGLVVFVIVSWSTFKKTYQSVDKRSLNAGLLAIVALISHIFFAVATDAVAHPHYLQAVWWAPYLMIIVTNDQINQRLQKWLKVILCFGVLLNLIVLCRFGKLMQEKSGYPSSHLGPAMYEQRRSVGEMCSLSSGEVKINFDQRDPVICVNCIRWHLLHLEQCKNVLIYHSSLEGKQSSFAEDDSARVSWMR